MKLFITFILVVTSFNAFSNTASDIKKLVMQNLVTSQNEDMQAVMQTMHPDAGAYASTQNVLSQIFSRYDLKYQLLEFHFVGIDGDYAYARIVQKTEKINGPEFRKNQLEALQVFKKKDGQWKLWTQANLKITYL